LHGLVAFYIRKSDPENMQVIVSCLKSESSNVIDVAFEEIVFSDILLKTQSVFYYSFLDCRLVCQDIQKWAKGERAIK